MNGSLVIPEDLADPDDSVSWAAEERQRSWLETVRRDTDWMFAWLLIAQWLIGLAVAVFVSPRAWMQLQEPFHYHVKAATLLGGLFTALPVLLIANRPGAPLTRHVVAVGQVLISGLLIHLTGGRLEMHFLLVASLALIALYRDWQVLLSATVVALADLMIRGTLCPQSLFGTAAAEPWHCLQQISWLVAESAALQIMIHWSLRETRTVAERESTQEILHQNALQESQQQITALQSKLDQREQAVVELGNIFSLSLDIICVAGFDGMFKRLNPAAEQLLGRPLHEVMARPFIDVVHPNDVAKTKAEVEKLAKGGRTILFEIRIRCGVNDYRWVLWNAIPIPGGKLFYASGRDITERKKSEEALRGSEERFRQLAASINDVFWMSTSDLKETLYVSPAYEKIWGRPTENLQDSPHEWLESIHDEDRDKVIETFSKLGPETPSVSVEYRVVRPDESIRWVRDREFHVHNDAGEVKLTAGIVSDITERRTLERHLQLQTEARLILAESSSLDEAAPKLLRAVCETLEWAYGAFWSLDRQAMTLRCANLWKKTDPCFEEFSKASIGMTFDRGTGLPGRVWETAQSAWVTDVVCDPNFPRAPLAKIAELHGAFAFPIVAAGEVLHVVEFFSHEIRKPDDELLRVFANISSQLSQFLERSQLEHQLIQSQKMETVGRLAGGVAHEFNSIMTAIIGQSELLLSDLPTGNSLARNAAEIRKAADRAASLTRQLLAYGRKQILQLEMIDLNRIIFGMEGVIRHLMGSEVELALVPGVGGNIVKADAGQIEQVIINMVINARDAMPRGGKLTLEVSNVVFEQIIFPEMKPGPYVMLAISDTGGGMSDLVRLRVFEPFFSTKGLQATGLGLATCYGIIKQSHGHITVHSEPDKGATFKIYLPQAQREVKSTPKPTNPQQLPGGTETVLLVEEDVTMREMTSMLLGRLGYVVLTAADESNALNLAERRGREPIDLLFADSATLPGSGQKLSEQIRELQPRTRILLTSPHSVVPANGNGNGNGRGPALLQKPFTPRSLALKLREVLDA